MNLARALPLVRPADLPRLLGGDLAVLLAGALADQPWPEACGLAAWGLRTGPQGAPCLLPAGAPLAAGEDWLPCPAPPAGVLALLAPEAGLLDGALGWWRAEGQEPPPCHLAASLAEAWPWLCGRLAAALADTAGQVAGLRRGLARLQREAQEERAAQAGLLRQLGQQPPMAPRLVLAAEPGPGCLALGPGTTARLRQPLGLASAAGLTRLALHVAGPAAPAATGLLRLRLVAEAALQVLGAWALPLAALRPGWLLLDLPTPLEGRAAAGPALLLLEATGEGLALSLDAQSAEAAASPPAAGPASPTPEDKASAPAGAALALRAWQAEPGRRCIAPPYWCWEEPGRRLLPDGDLTGTAAGPLPLGLPHALPNGSWALAAALAGQVSRLGLGAEPPRPLLRTTAPGIALLHLPQVHGAGFDVLRLVARSRDHEAGLRLALVLRPAAWAVAGPADLWPESGATSGAPGPGWDSGWRGFTADGWLELALPIPLALRRQLQLGILLAGPQGQPVDRPLAAAVERLELLGSEGLLTLDTRPEAGLPWPPPAEEDEADAAMPEAPLLRAGAASAEAVLLHQYSLPSGSSGYRHLDISLLSLAAPGARWPAVRFKFTHVRNKPRLEFRPEPEGRPESFSRWTGMEEDSFGPVLRLGVAELPGHLALPEVAPRDALLLRSLLALLPGAAASAAGQAGLAPAEQAQWVGYAEALAAALPEG